MATDIQKEIEARKQSNDLRREEQRLLERRVELEIQLSQETDKRLKSARDIKDELQKTNILINRNSDQQSRQETEIAKIKKERLDKTAAITELEKSLVNEAKTTRNLSKDLGKILTNNKNSIFESLGITQSTVIARKTANDQLQLQLRDENLLKDLTADQINQKRQQIVINNGLSNIEKELLEEVQAGSATEMTSEEILNKLKDRGLDITKLTKEQLEQMNKQVERIAGASKMMNENFQKGYEFVNQMDNTMLDLIDKSEKLGAVLSSFPLALQAFNALAIGAAVSFGKDVFDAAREVRQELGLSVTEAGKLGFEITRNAKLLGVLGGNAEEVKNFTIAIAKEFGNVGSITNEVNKQFIALSATTGITGEEAAKLASQIQSIQGGTLESSLNTLEIFKNLADAEGVSSRLVIEGLAADAEVFAKFAGEGGTNLALAEIQARKLGLSLNDVASIAENLLSFEDSIQKQLEAQVILGRSINLDKARELSFAGDLEGLQKELVRLVGSEAEFSRMSFIERQALADALGTNAANLAKIVRGEDEAALLAKQKAEQEKKSLETQIKIAEAMEKGVFLLGLTEGIQASIFLIQMASRALQKSKLAYELGFIALQRKERAISLSTAVIEATKVAFKNPLGIAIGLAAAGLAAAGIYRLAKSRDSEGMAEGGMVGRDGGAVAPSDTIPMMLTPGEVVLNAAQQRNVAGAITNNNVDTSKMENLLSSVLNENKKMNTESKLLREQNEVLMNRLIRKQDGLRLANA